MTPDEIETAAIEAANIAYRREWAGPTPGNAMRAAIRAYERAMWRPIEEAPQGEPILTNCKHGLIEGRYKPEPGGVVEGYYFREMSWYATHFRPLPRREGE